MDGITMLRAQAELNNALYLRFTGDTDRARIFVKRSLQVRPDYQDARRVAASLGLGGAGGTGEI
jgi:hypothetical protein